MSNVIRKSMQSIRDELGGWLILLVITLFAATVMNRYWYGELTPFGMITLISFVITGFVSLPIIFLQAMIREQ